MNELVPFGFAATGKVLDGLVTSLYCDRYGTKREWSYIHKELMNKYGVWRSFPKRQLVAQGVLLGTGIALYCIDSFMQIENKPINLHKGWLYGAGGLTYICAFNNSLRYILEWIKEKQVNKN